MDLFTAPLTDWLSHSFIDDLIYQCTDSLMFNRLIINWLIIWFIASNWLIDFIFLVCPDTEMTIFHDDFFKGMDVVVNALDNVAARQYMDR